MILTSNREPTSQKIKESKLLKDIEAQQQLRTYGSIHHDDVAQQEPRPSTFTQIKEGVKGIYRRLSGQNKKKSHYQQILDDQSADGDFGSSLRASKKRGQQKGTFAIVNEPDIDLEKELKKINAERERRRQSTHAESLLDTPVPTNQPWPIMQEFRERNEENIRRSIARTDQEETEQRIRDGLMAPTRLNRGRPSRSSRMAELDDVYATRIQKLFRGRKARNQTRVSEGLEPPRITPPEPPLTPQRQLTINKFGQLVGRSQLKKKEGDDVFNKVFNKLKKTRNKINEYSSQIADLNAQRAELQPVIENHDARTIQNAIRGKIARNALKSKAATRIQNAIRI